MKNTNTENQDTFKKSFNMHTGILKIFLASIIVFCVFYTAKAALVDTTLENLEKNYSSSINLYFKLEKAAEAANKNKQSGADAACDTFRALKSYKESKKLPLKNNYNPCVALAAPQEGF